MPGGAFACGSGTATGFGAFTTELTFDQSCECVVTTLTFSDGSALVLDEDFLSITAPGASLSHMPSQAAGHPSSVASSWALDSGTGSFAGATGSGTDVLISAGLTGTGSLGGTITTP